MFNCEKNVSRVYSYGKYIVRADIGRVLPRMVLCSLYYARDGRKWNR